VRSAAITERRLYNYPGYDAARCDAADYYPRLRRDSAADLFHFLNFGVGKLLRSCRLRIGQRKRIRLNGRYVALVCRIVAQFHFDFFVAAHRQRLNFGSHLLGTRSCGLC